MEFYDPREDPKEKEPHPCAASVVGGKFPELDHTTGLPKNEAKALMARLERRMENAAKNNDAIGKAQYASPTTTPAKKPPVVHFSSADFEGGTCFK